MTTAASGGDAAAARAAFREQADAKGHVVDNARIAADGLEAAFAAGALVRTPTLDLMLGDLARALEQDDGQRLGGKSAEAARFILRAISRELDRRLNRSSRAQAGTHAARAALASQTGARFMCTRTGHSARGPIAGGWPLVAMGAVGGPSHAARMRQPKDPVRGR